MTRGLGQIVSEPLPRPCIVTFGGSALRAGGGYAESILHVLENPEEDGGDDDDSDEDQSSVDESGRRLSFGGVIGADLNPAASSRRQSFNKFQT